MKNILICILLFFICQPLLATSIVVLITPEYIVIGADSRRMIINAENGHTVNETVCKIRKVNNYCYAVAGLVASATTSFSADAIINKHLQNNANVAKALRLIKRDIRKALRAELLVQKAHRPKQYGKTLESRDHILEVVVVSFKNKVPQAHVIGFELVNLEKTLIKDYTASCTGNCVGEGNQLFFLGEYSGMEKYLNAASRNASDPISLVNQLILSQAKITPSTVGTPVSLVKFTSEGVTWINTSCAD